VAASAIATSICITLIPNQNQAVLAATVATTLIILIFAETAPKTFAAQNPVKTALRLGYPVRGLMFLLYPLVKALSFVTGLLIPSLRKRDAYAAVQLNEEETRIALHAGARGLSGLRRRIVSGALDFGSRPVKEVMVPRPEIRAIEIGSGREEILSAIRSTGYSRYPVFRSRLDNIEGIIYSKDIISYLIDNKSFDIKEILRKAFFVPDLASLEKVLLQMQERALHMALVVDEFGNVDGLVTLEDIIEEIVGRSRTSTTDRRRMVLAARRRPFPRRRCRPDQRCQHPRRSAHSRKARLYDVGRILPLRVRTASSREGLPGVRTLPIDRRKNDQAPHHSRRDRSVRAGESIRP